MSESTRTIIAIIADIIITCYFISKQDVRRAIKRIVHTGGVATRTGDALQFMRRNSFLPKNGGREGVTKVRYHLFI